MSQVCQYLSNKHPAYLKMIANSIYMLRRYNKTIPVRLFLVEDQGQATFTTNANHEGLVKAKDPDKYISICKNLGTEVKISDPLDTEFFHIHRSLFKDTKEDSVLFIDADTFIFGDVGDLFDKYREYDYVGLPIVHLIGWNDNWLPFRPYNSAINLWNHGNVRKFSLELPEWCRKLKEREHFLSDYCYARCMRGNNREEFAVSLFLESHPELTHTCWNYNEVRNSATRNDYRDLPEYMFHTFTHNWQFAYKSFAPKVKFPFTVLKAIDHEKKYKSKFAIVNKQFIH